MLTVKQESLNGSTVLAISGRFEFGERKVFSDALAKAQEGDVTHVILNFKNVLFVDSAALGLLALAQQNLKLKNGRISIVNPQEYVKKVLEMANFPKFIPMFLTNEEAARKPVFA